MYLRKNRVKGKTYWTLVETYRTERGPRQRVVSYLGDLDEPVRAGVKALAEERPRIAQGALFDEDLAPDWQEIDTGRVKVERSRAFGDWWVGLCLLQKLGLTDLLEDIMPAGREEVPWSTMALTSVLCRLCEPSSELHIAETLYERSPLPDLLGIPVDRMNDDRLYRTLDRLLPHKDALQKHLADRLGSLFEVEYDLLLYDVTSTFFEGQCAANADALWRAYIQLTQAEAAFHIHKSDLKLRPIWHQLSHRVGAHILICFLAYVLWTTLGELCKAAGLGDEPRRVLDELREIRLVDVVMTTRNGQTIRRRCVTQPSNEQAMLLSRLNIKLPKQLKVTQM